MTNSSLVKDLLTLFQGEGKSLALVIDVKGRAVGIVTMKDALRKLVGDLSHLNEDHPAPRSRQIILLGKNHILANGHVDLMTIREKCGLTLPDKPYRTLASFMSERIPSPLQHRQSLKVGSIKMTVEDATGGAIQQVRIRWDGEMVDRS